MSGRLRLALALLLGALALLPARAHQASDAYLRAGSAADGTLTLQAEVALRDLDLALELDTDGDGRLSWGEVRRREAEIGARVLAGLTLSPERCTLRPAADRALALDRKADGVYAVLHYTSACSAADGPQLAYTLFQGVDPTHRGLLRGDAADPRTAAPLRSLVPGGAAVAPWSGSAAADLADAGPGFFADGLHHILIGADHVLFLVCLLLPLALGRGDAPPPRGRALWWPLFGLVTAFTVAHSITLGLAAWRVLAVPPSVIEPLIAASIAVAAADNLRPLLGRWRTLAAFGFGLVHGFGFAGPLLEIDLPPAAMAWAMLQFNLGVEAGQLVVVALAVLALHPLRGHGGAAWMRGGSAVAGLLALVWLGERVLDVKLLPV